MKNLRRAWSLLIDGGGEIKWWESALADRVLSGTLENWLSSPPCQIMTGLRGITIKRVPEELKTSPAQLSPLLGELTIKEILQGWLIDWQVYQHSVGSSDKVLTLGLFCRSLVLDCRNKYYKMGLLVLLTSLRSVRTEELFLKCPGNLRDLLNYSDGLFKSMKIIN